jgi:hypothetical protein
MKHKIWVLTMYSHRFKAYFVIGTLAFLLSNVSFQDLENILPHFVDSIKFSTLDKLIIMYACKKNLKYIARLSGGTKNVENTSPDIRAELKILNIGSYT